MPLAAVHDIEGGVTVSRGSIPSVGSWRMLRRGATALFALGVLAMGAPLLATGPGSAGASMTAHGVSLCGQTTSTTTSTLAEDLPSHLRGHVVIDCSPTVPVGLHVTRHGGTVTGWWTQGYTPADWYLCTLLFGNQPSGLTERTFVDHCTFTGLAPTGAYQVRVVGLNQYGSSPMAQAKAPNPPVTTITCVSGKRVRHVTGVRPLCPIDFVRH